MSDTSLSGICVIKFTHMILGPSVSAIFASLGGEAIHGDPIGGHRARTLLGSAAGCFPAFNRGKQSICLDLKSTDGIAVAKKFIDSTDVLVENYGPGTMERLDLDYETLSATNSRLIYCSTKGFLQSSSEQRSSLDVVAQLMGSLAYMT